MQTMAQCWVEKDLDSEQHSGDGSANDNYTAAVYVDNDSQCKR